MTIYKFFWWLGLPLRLAAFVLLAALLGTVGLLAPSIPQEIIPDLWGSLVLAKYD